MYGVGFDGLVLILECDVMNAGVEYCSLVNSAACAESVPSLDRVPLLHVRLGVHDFGPNKPLLHVGEVSHHRGSHTAGQPQDVSR